MNLYRKIRNRLWRWSLVGQDTGHHITRYAMYRRLARIGEILPRLGGSALIISHSRQLMDNMGVSVDETVEADYPEYNMLSLSLPDNRFEYVFSDQVLEHLAGNPQDAINECYRVLKPGGIAVHTTCFINPIHGAPDDYWRFTPAALRLLHQGWSDVIEVRGWGNEDVWSVVRDGMRFEGVPNANWHPLHKLAIRNDPDWPIVTWIVAQK